ncbi:unnamed protein product [Symbiodinium sp. CCMP2592]|nr:unnamed protein product [Symbiodinium sp. CCMP2592]
MQDLLPKASQTKGHLDERGCCNPLSHVVVFRCEVRLTVEVSPRQPWDISQSVGLACRRRCQARPRRSKRKIRRLFQVRPISRECQSCSALQRHAAPIESLPTVLSNVLPTSSMRKCLPNGANLVAVLRLSVLPFLMAARPGHGRSFEKV